MTDWLEPQPSLTRELLPLRIAEIAEMPLLFPTQGTLHDVFHPAVPFGRYPEKHVERAPAPKRTPLQARSDLYTAWSVVDDAKDKANKLSAEATKEFEKASAKAQAKAGHIELYSAKYYAACTFGGLLACVSPRNSPLPGTTD
jgi:solute carrier family 25 phosphate transporter 3